MRLSVVHLTAEAVEGIPFGGLVIVLGF